MTALFIYLPYGYVDDINRCGLFNAQIVELCMIIAVLWYASLSSPCINVFCTLFYITSHARGNLIFQRILI